MCQHQTLFKLLCLLILAVGLADSQADVFPQCVNVEADTFVMAIDDCTSYIYCNGESSFRDSCPDQTYFDAKAQECAFDDNGVCLQPIATSEVVAANETQISNSDGLENETTTVDSQQPTEDRPAPIGSRPHCAATGVGYHPHPQRCEYYYSCIAGYLTIVRCPYKYGWDYALQQCKPVSEAQCFSL